ncbi:transcription initiation factor TFIID complex subunit TAF6 [Toxoplasma gondii ARI]|uniref:Transcription initiation factor TFIID complex subunit TAF6 n=1 Tax=Toxoplasma gondii ARI TaxID=1074872 RepID=A0A139XJW8_TOXGO|nr:transcription initiation factor TFIID complex subunit TAF6 [Toxoplasma gondii ARI]
MAVSAAGPASPSRQRPGVSSLATSSLMAVHVLSIARTHGYCSVSRGEGGPRPLPWGDRRERGDKLELLLSLQETLVSPAAAKVIGSMVQFRLVQLIKTAKKLMQQSVRVAQEGVLTVGDVHEAMSMLKMPPLLSYSGPSTYRFVTSPQAGGLRENLHLIRRETLRPFEGPSALCFSSSPPSAVDSATEASASASAAATVEGMHAFSRQNGEKAVGFSPVGASSSSRLINLIYADLKLPAPRDEALAIHWMAVAGSIPRIPQNVFVSSPRDARRPRKAEEGENPHASLALQLFEAERKRAKRRRSAGDKRPDRGGEEDGDRREERLWGRTRERKTRVTFSRGDEGDDSSERSSEESAEETERMPATWPLRLERILVAPRLCHALGKEHQQFLQAVRDTLQAAVEEKHGVDYERNLRKMLKIVSSIPGLEQLLPCLARFFAVELGASLHLPHRATPLLRLAEAILANHHLPLHSHVHQFLLPLLECLLRPLPLAASPSAALLPFTPQQLELRRKAAYLLGAFLCRARAQREQMESVEAAVLLQLKRHLLHPQSSLETVLGAVWGILALGRPATLLLLLPVLPLLLHTLERARSFGELEVVATSAARRLATQRDERQASAAADRADPSGVFAGPCSLKSADASALQQQQSLAALRMLLIDTLLQTLLSCVYDELSLQLTAATTGSAAFLLPGEGTAKSLGVSASALLQLMQVLYDDSRSLSDSYTPVVAAAFQRACAAPRLPPPAPPASPCLPEAPETAAGAPWEPERKLPLASLSSSSSLPSSLERKEVGEFVINCVLPSLHAMEASLDAQRSGGRAAGPREAGEREGRQKTGETKRLHERIDRDLTRDASYLLTWSI